MISIMLSILLLSFGFIVLMSYCPYGCMIPFGIRCNFVKTNGIFAYKEDFS